VFRSKLFQRNLWRFCGISKGYKASKRPLMASKFFSLSRPFLDAFWTPPDRIRCLAWSASDGPPDFTMQFGRRRVHRRAAIQIERIFNLTDNPISGKKNP
jgi:hypothetical protein